MMKYDKKSVQLHLHAHTNLCLYVYCNNKPDLAVFSHACIVGKSLGYRTTHAAEQGYRHRSCAAWTI